MTLAHPHPACTDCNRYLERRADALPRWIVHYAKKRGMPAGQLAVEFFRGVHRRHLAGLSLGAD